ncbi:MAG: hypothetical protein ACR2OE_17125 [Thermomicrobiales bacterium]
MTPKSRIENTRDVDNNLLPTKEKHLLADENGDFPVGTLNDWEMKVIDVELNREEDTIAWYRNPSRPSADALQIPYQIGEQWKPMQPDFIFFTRNQDGTFAASIVDPHGDHLADALPKLIGLANFAEKYEDQFLRIEAISQIDGKELRMLDLTKADVRNAVHEATNATDLYRGKLAEKYE